MSNSSRATPSPELTNSSATPPQSSFDLSVEQLRGTPARRPSFLRPAPYPVFEELAAPESPINLQDFPFLREYLTPLDERRRIPGSGINQHDLFDEPISCETGPINPKPPNFNHSRVENVFDQFDQDPSLEAFFGRMKFVQDHFQEKQYGRSQRPQQPRRLYPAQVSPLLSDQSSESVLFPQSRSPQPQRSVDPRYPFLTEPLSPLSTSSSSSSSSSSPSPSFVFSPSSYSRFQPISQSTFTETPPRPGAMEMSPPIHFPSFSPTPPDRQRHSTPVTSPGSESSSSTLVLSRARTPIPESPVPGWSNFPRTPEPSP